MQLWGRIFQRIAYALYRQRVTVLLVLLIGAGLGTFALWQNQNQAATSNVPVGSGTGIEVSVQALTPLSGNRPGATLTLKERNGNRRIAMSVGQTEELAIADSMGLIAGQIPQSQLPQSYTLLNSTVQAMGGHIDRVAVSGANQTQYLAQIVVDAGGGDLRTVQARPADAIATALVAKAPIYVDSGVLDKYGTTGNTTTASTSGGN